MLLHVRITAEIKISFFFFKKNFLPRILTEPRVFFLTCAPDRTKLLKLEQHGWFLLFLVCNLFVRCFLSLLFQKYGKISLQVFETIFHEFKDRIKFQPNFNDLSLTVVRQSHFPPISTLTHLKSLTLFSPVLLPKEATILTNLISLSFDETESYHQHF